MVAAPYLVTASDGSSIAAEIGRPRYEASCMCRSCTLRRRRARSDDRFRGGADQDGLQPALQGFLGEVRPREVCQDLGRTAGWREPYGPARLRRVPGW